MYLSFGKKTTKGYYTMNTEFKTALNKFLNNPDNDVYKIVTAVMRKYNDVGYCHYSHKIGWVNDNLYDIDFVVYSNSMCSNIEVWIRKFDDYGNFQAKEKICLYDIMNDSWDGLLSTEEYTEKQLFDMEKNEPKKLNQLLTDIIINDVTDIICFAGD